MVLFPTMVFKNRPNTHQVVHNTSVSLQLASIRAVAWDVIWDEWVRAGMVIWDVIFGCGMFADRCTFFGLLASS